MIPGEEPSAGAGLYVHVPFCSSVCPYCDFAVVIAGIERRDRFVQAIAEEAERRAHLELRFDTFYLGGGTPSSLQPDQLARVVDAVRSRLDVAPGGRLFLEVNPEDVTAQSVRWWRDLGFGTVSLGAQSFDDRALRFLGRRHSADRARQAWDVLRETGFHTISVDLMYGLPGQTADAWRSQLDAVAALEPDHLSCYQLTVHAGTVFGGRRDRGELVEAPEPLQAELFRLTHAVLADAGYDGYEVSNFARDREHRSRHNLKYWNHTPYLGLGPSAHSFVGRRRWWNQRKLRLWQRALAAGCSPEEGSESLSDRELALETVMLGLRTSDGIDMERFHTRYGVDLMATNRGTVERLVDSGHLVIEGGTLRPTVSGMAIADTLARSLEIEDPQTGGAVGTYTEAGSDV